jgi:hypothetical protein
MWQNHRSVMTDETLDLIQGTLDVMVLQTLLAIAEAPEDRVICSRRAYGRCHVRTAKTIT